MFALQYCVGVCRVYIFKICKSRVWLIIVLRWRKSSLHIHTLHIDDLKFPFICVVSTYPVFLNAFSLYFNMLKFVQSHSPVSVITIVISTFCKQISCGLVLSFRHKDHRRTPQSSYFLSSGRVNRLRLRITII